MATADQNADHSRNRLNSGLLRGHSEIVKLASSKSDASLSGPDGAGRATSDR